jgi:hypothetical protein
MDTRYSPNEEVRPPIPSNDSHLIGNVIGHIGIVEYNLACEPNAGHIQVLVDSRTEMPLYGGPGNSPAMNASSNQQATVQHKNPHDKFLASGILIICCPQSRRHHTSLLNILGRMAIGYKELVCNPTQRLGSRWASPIAVPRKMAEL